MIKNIVFDLSGTIFKPEIRHNPCESLILYMWGTYKIPSNSDTCVIDIFSESYINNDPRYQGILLHNGQPVPPLISAWLAGEINSETALAFAMQEYYKFLKYDKLPVDEKKQDLIK